MVVRRSTARFVPYPGVRSRPRTRRARRRLAREGTGWARIRSECVPLELYRSNPAGVVRPMRSVRAVGSDESRRTSLSGLVRRQVTVCQVRKIHNRAPRSSRGLDRTPSGVAPVWPGHGPTRRGSANGAVGPAAPPRRDRRGSLLGPMMQMKRGREGGPRRLVARALGCGLAWLVWACWRRWTAGPAPSAQSPGDGSGVPARASLLGASCRSRSCSVPRPISRVRARTSATLSLACSARLLSSRQTTRKARP